MCYVLTRAVKVVRVQHRSVLECPDVCDPSMRMQVVGAECTRGVCNGLTRRAERINTLKMCTRGRDVSGSLQESGSGRSRVVLCYGPTRVPYI
jgi:hypothetical protein